MTETLMLTELVSVTKPVSRDMQEFTAKLTHMASIADANDREELSTILGPGEPYGVITLSPTVAAILYVENNKHNREFSLAKASWYAQCMRRGEWRLIHQGLALYPDNTIADGQHRIAAVALSNTRQQFTLFRDFDPEAMKAIDVGKRRTAGDALQLGGVPEGKLAAAIAETIMKYEHRRIYTRSFMPSIYEIEDWTRTNINHVRRAIDIATIAEKSDPPLSKAETASIALGMLTGGYDPGIVEAFLTAVNEGTGKAEGAPTIDLFKTFYKAKSAAGAKGRLTKEEKLALAFKRAMLFYKDEVTAGLRWKAGKEPLPAPTPPVANAAE